MSTLIDVLRVVHVISAVLMAWPFYALVAVNQRVRLGQPLGDRLDTYLENLIKNRAIPCYVFQATVFLTGLALVFLRNQNLSAFITYPTLGVKFLLLLVIISLLSYVYFNLHPKIDSLFVEGGNPVRAEIAPRISALRSRRKQMASFCLFAVLTNAMLGMQTWVSFPLWLTGFLVLMIALFTWRAYTSITAYGWV